MQVEVEGGGVLTAASHLSMRRARVEGQLPRCAALPDGLADPALRGGVTDLADVVADVLELVAHDLELLAGKVRAGVALYDRVEERVRVGMSRP